MPKRPKSEDPNDQNLTGSIIDPIHPNDNESQLLQQIDDLTVALQRERADAVNMRNRFDAEKKSLAGFYKSLVIKDLIPILDNYDRALSHTPKELENNDYVKGLNSILSNLKSTLEKSGLKMIVASPGTEFDPNLHEAVAGVDDSEFEEGQIVEELSKGYIFEDQVLRHSMVKVAA